MISTGLLVYVIIHSIWAVFIIGFLSNTFKNGTKAQLDFCEKEIELRFKPY